MYYTNLQFKRDQIFHVLKFLYPSNGKHGRQQNFFQGGANSEASQICQSAEGHIWL